MNRMAGIAGVLVVACAINGCIGFSPKVGVHTARKEDGPFKRVADAPEQRAFTPEAASAAKAFASPGTVEEFSKPPPETGYRLGPGDAFAFLVRGRPEISREEIIVSPDGEVALPRAGIINVQGQTLAQVTTTLNEKLRRFYDDPDVTLVMKRFSNNKVFVLGRVANPGAVHFTGRGTLLEALSLSGGLPVDTVRSFLTRCMIIRGKDMVIWIDLKDLLENGNMALNATLQNNDIVYIPQSEDQMAYVMGMVQMPGVLLLRNTMTVLDAVMQSGGLARDADPDDIYLVRQVDGTGVVERIDFATMVERGDLRQNYVLKDGDILYVDEQGASKFNYYLSKLMPSMDVIDFTIRTAESFGAMAELRRKLWGQEGFVNQGY
ncbi:MAG TPA: polysaccharide biosynthesis/export family protein [Kiritimatiellia bacterium]|nr:polysaccharide biosynthesis/export family protein [Kiritimatiellia bacterium]HMP34824.1 polysaccharide biosynthesis/export family protein [Kiritimatiellia bacterium]